MDILGTKSTDTKSIHAFFSVRIFFFTVNAVFKESVLTTLFFLPIENITA